MLLTCGSRLLPQEAVEEVRNLAQNIERNTVFASLFIAHSWLVDLVNIFSVFQAPVLWGIEDIESDHRPSDSLIVWLEQHLEVESSTQYRERKNSAKLNLTLAIPQPTPPGKTPCPHCCPGTGGTRAPPRELLFLVQYLKEEM